MGPLSPLVTTLRRTPPLVFAMAVLATGLVVSSSVLVKGVRRGNDTITVTGSSTERITSDFVDWTVDVARSAPTLQASYQELQPEVQRTIDFLRQQGIPADAISRNPIKSDKSEVRDSRTGELQSTTFTTRQQIRISSPEVEKVAAVAQQIGELVGQGVPLTINDPAYTYTRLSEKRVDMLAKATRDARLRAREIARQAGSHIGVITQADTGSFQITVPNSTEMSSFGSYDTTTIEKDITAVMGVTFRVD
ncbi:SIMPL domain-containing protein [Synechococcus sp. CBW1107]|uniref:SIMPL domain-containing protein n=1 Tax=Synechococcus sp. CBW1107 TaxID=2789857 RepID=UPI0018CECC9A|nr:SIMPL domain-containing protein [Synechococcus sp. CBW1107]QPN55807.1 SIMPL domain-containing protein [Synechococcus sp. CBW1107]